MDDRLLALPTIVISTITRSEIFAGTIGCILPIIMGDDNIHWRITTHGPYLDCARNTAIRDALEHHPDLDILLFVDSDMVFTPTDLGLVCGACTPERPVVGGYYLNPTGFTPDDGPPIAPVAAILNTDGKLYQLSTEAFDHPDKPPLIQVDGVGTGFMAIHRKLIDTLPDMLPPATPWFRETDFMGDRIGEDYAFCLDVAKLGYPILVHREARIKHHKAMLI